MEFFRPTTWSEALAARAEHPDAVPIAGGTDLMVGLNFGHAAPVSLLDLTAIGELSEWGRDGGFVRIGAGVTYARVIDELGAECPGLATASRTVGSPQIRHAGTLGGNLGTCSPAGDGLPVLAALDAVVHLASTRGERSLPVADFMVGVKRTACA